VWKEERKDDGTVVQYWTGRNPYDPEFNPYHQPIPNIPISDNELIFDDNAGETRKTGGGIGRFYGKGDFYDALFKLGHSLNNLAWGQGGWRRFHCNVPQNKEIARTTVVWNNKPRSPTPQQAMGRAIFGVSACEAWEYANYIGVKTPDKGQNYEWCHLLGHGLGGKETVGNLVAATHACNTEQLCIERWLRDKAARGIKCEVKINAQMAREGPHLAEAISYTVYGPCKGPLLYYKWIDARRTVEPSPSERDKVWGILEAAYKKLR
jgi:hypothetical protein